jgi:diadenylate cyclase
LKGILEYLYSSSTYELLIILVELLLIGVVVYWAVSFLEGTRGERLFRGVIFILVVGSFLLNLVANQFGLSRIAFLYKGFLLAILIIAVAAFQPEIRRMLIRIGQTRFLQSNPQQLSRSVEEIISAVSQMSGTRTGAIMVIEQQVGLGEFIDTGVRIDSRVTAELLKTIFYPGTPLHDMAVVIRGDRLLAARVQLPLAEGDSFQGRQLGSRHRAAVGVTGGSDATVIVVSEETGTVSVAMNGNLIRNVSETELRRYLTTAVVETAPIVESISSEGSESGTAS